MKNLLLALLFLTAAQYNFAQTKLLDANKLTVKDSIVLKGKAITDVTTDTALGTSNTKLPVENAVKSYVDKRVTPQGIDTVYRNPTGTYNNVNNFSYTKKGTTTTVDLNPAFGDWLGANNSLKSGKGYSQGFFDFRVMTRQQGAGLWYSWRVPQNFTSATDIVTNGDTIGNISDAYLPYVYYNLNSGKGITDIYVGNGSVSGFGVHREINISNSTGNAVTLHFIGSVLSPAANGREASSSGYLSTLTLAAAKTVKLVSYWHADFFNIRWVVSGLSDNSATTAYTIPAGGTTGYVLKKNSVSDYDYSWQPDISGTGGVSSETDPTVPSYLKNWTVNDSTRWSNKQDAIGYPTVAANAAISAGTGMKITYDAKGLVTGSSSATTADVAASTDKNYVTDAQKTVISNTTGVNTGDETVTTIKSKLGITTLSGSNTGDETLSTIKSKLGITVLSGSNTGDDKTAVTGIIKGSGGNQVAATADVDYYTPTKGRRDISDSLATVTNLVIDTASTGVSMVVAQDAQTIKSRALVDGPGYRVNRDDGDTTVSLDLDMPNGGLPVDDSTKLPLTGGNLTGSLTVSSGNSAFGTSTPDGSYKLLINGSSSLLKMVGTSGSGPLYKSESTIFPTTGTPNVIFGKFYGGTYGYNSSAGITFNSTEAYSSSSLPGNISFLTVSKGSTGLTEKFRIGSEGRLSNTGTTADSTSQVDFSYAGPTGSKRGMLIPRMTEAEKTAIATPADGLFIYQTDGTKGFYYYSATTSSWSQLGAGSGLDSTKLPLTGGNLTGSLTVSSGNSAFGTSTPDGSYKLLINGSSSLLKMVGTSGSGPLYKSESTIFPTTGTPNVIFGKFYGGTYGYNSSAGITFNSTEAYSSSSLPGNISFLTVNKGSTGLTEKFRIGSEGRLSNTGTTADSTSQVDFSYAGPTGSKRGMLIPTMTQAERLAIPNPTLGMLVNQSDGASTAQGLWQYTLSTDPGWVHFRTANDPGTATATSGDSYTLQVAGPSFNPALSTNYYVGPIPGYTSATVGINKLYIPATGRITKVFCYWSTSTGTAGSSTETSNTYVSVNGGSPNLIASGNIGGASTGSLSNTAMNIAVTEGQYIELRYSTPSAWATAPTQLRLSFIVYIQP